ncbi:MAG: undecaprenyldiphospho-muramoylpentapeptide beta-N-acetylglucosaminyltransferase [Acidobacteria bacterium]|nr:undecaprenyldiphospho-muramoylpentapeptide beta-N-acetylglucosaminyltransferase [Acidobacteriota bacterium]
MNFVMTGGGTGGHVVPALAVADELRKRGHSCSFVGTREGFEARLVPQAGFEIDFISVAGLNRVGRLAQLRTLAQLPVSVAASWGILSRRRPAAIFSMGGYVAGPPMLAAKLRGVPQVLMEPNAMPGLVSRWTSGWVAKALVSFEEARSYFPPGVAEVTGVPVRERFFAVPPKAAGEKLTVLVTGGSRGSQRLNNAVREAWPLFLKSGAPVRLIQQTGSAMQAEMERDFRQTGLDGLVTAFVEDMPAAFAEADLVICRSGAGAVAELAAAGRPAILVPFPFAADDHQRRNAEALERAGAGRLVLDRELNGQRLLDEVRAISPQLLPMAAAARGLAKPEAARRAASVLEQIARVQ